MGFNDAATAWGLVGVVFLAVLGSEAVSYAFVYRRADYKRACDRVRELTNKCSFSASLQQRFRNYILATRVNPFSHQAVVLSSLFRSVHNPYCDAFFLDEKAGGKLVSVDKRKAHDRYITRLEEEVKEATSKMNGMKMRSTIATSIGFFMLYRTVASSYSGLVVARLPFLPFKMLRGFTHRGLESEDIRDCGFGFIYSLATMALKQNIPKLLGFSAPRSAYDPSKAAARIAAKADSES